MTAAAPHPRGVSTAAQCTGLDTGGFHGLALRPDGGGLNADGLCDVCTAGHVSKVTRYQRGGYLRAALAALSVLSRALRLIAAPLWLAAAGTGAV